MRWKAKPRSFTEAIVKANFEDDVQYPKEYIAAPPMPLRYQTRCKARISPACSAVRPWQKPITVSADVLRAARQPCRCESGYPF